MARRRKWGMWFTLVQRYLKALCITLTVMLFPMTFVGDTATFREQLMDITKDCTMYNSYLGQLNETFWLKAAPFRSKAEMYGYAPEEATVGHEALSPCSHQPQYQASPEPEIEGVPSWDLIESDNLDVNIGGEWQPLDCVPQHRLAIIIPYRDRESHLRKLLSTLHPFLKQQNIDYRIFVVEQDHSSSFNRGAVKNIGALIAMKLKNFDCLYFHDVDLIPQRNDNIYSCSQNPRHLSFAVKKSDSIEYAYSTHFGGVISLTKQQFINANGFSNIYFSWGSEDDDLSKRLRHLGYTVEQNDPDVGVYEMLTHVKDTDIRKRYWQLLWGHCRYHHDGLTTLPFRLLKIHKYRTHTLIKVAIDEKHVRAVTPDMPQPSSDIRQYLKPYSKWQAFKRVFFS